MQILSVMAQSGRKVSECCHLYEPAPQVLQNARADASALEAEPVQAAIKAAEKRLGNRGRLVIRKSGTEPVVRVMAEGDEETVIREVVADLVEALHRAARAI
jgi:phosphoglucosamine mutase